MTPVAIRRREDVSLSRASARTEGRVVYAVGDVHGRYDLLIALLEAIRADVADVRPVGRALLLFLGDYIDRGPQTAEVLTTLVWLSRHADFDLTFLRGNHEDMMLAFLSRPQKAASWLRVGGTDTLRAYGVEVPDGRADPDECVRLRDELMDRLPASHLAFLRLLESYAVHGEYVFVHAGLRPGIPLEEQSEKDLLWIREDFLAAEPFDRIVVHGHSWTSDAPAMTARRIGIDTGAYKTGALTAVRLGAGDVAFIQACAADG